MQRSPVKVFGLIILASFLILTTACDKPDSAVNSEPDPSLNASGDCDRECLLGVLDNYLEALVANAPSQINVADSLKYTDNGVAAELGQGLWMTAAAVDNEKRLDFADPVQKNVATQVVVNERVENSAEENSTGCDGANSEGLSPVIYQVRLKVEQGVITEIEAMTLRLMGAAGMFNPKNLKPESVFTQSIPADQRMSREELIALMDLYVDYLEGSVVGKEVPFDKKCKRYENGIVTAAGVPMFNMQSFWFFNVTRRYPVIDEEAGIVWGILPFFQTKTSLVVGEAFKMFDGKIKMIQAVMRAMPAKAWDE